ncbi:TPA: thiaminase II [Candidatus Micrarchaeota archaeon]|nr:thiaminase II [Candidatus Micrarchaeota archaeon]
MRLAERLRRSADGVWKRILEHPFVVELYEGTLPIEKFKFYILQDYNYLVALIRALSIVASKAEFGVAREVLRLAYAEATTELEGYESLLSKLGYSVEDAVRTEPAPTNIAYANFMLATSSLGSEWEGLAAVLPCFWSYAEIAEVHRSRLERNPNRLYVEWASVYLSKEYREVVDKLVALIDRAPDALYERLERVFITGSRYEYMFWDMAYNMERWPV